MTLSLLALLILLQVKHLIVDWCWQPAYEWMNKGKYGHPGGLRHSAKNAVGTMLCFMFFVSPLAALGVLVIDFLVHYHIDWAKMNINKKMKWGPTTHDEFWALTGADQFLHQVTYILLAFTFVV